MDEERRIRFLVSPILFFASLGWGSLRDPSWRLAEHFHGLTVEPQNAAGLIALLAGGGIAVFAIGFLIGTITYVWLRLAFMARRTVLMMWGWVRHASPTCDVRNVSHEIGFSGDTLRQVWFKVCGPGMPDRTRELFAGVAFDHGYLRANHEGIHRWMTRRWNAFSVNITSFTSLFLSLVVGWLIGIAVSPPWWIPVAMACWTLCVAAVLAWRDAMGMAAFQAARPPHPEAYDG